MKRIQSFVKLIILHFSLMGIVTSGLIFLFFQFLLPAITHHGQFITVPSLKGISLEEVEVILTQRNLCFEVTKEAAYVPEYPPMTVLQQHPKAGAHVKEGRKVYLTLNAQTPPQVKMPNLVDGSVRNAHVHLKSQGLLLGAIKYVPDIAQNTVLEQWYQGAPIAPGTLVSQGNKIDLVVGAGLDKKQVAVPDVVGMPLEEAQSLFLDAGIKVGNIAYKIASPDAVPGTIWRQVPAADQQVYRGESIDLWLVPLPEEEKKATDTPLLPEN